MTEDFLAIAEERGIRAQYPRPRKMVLITGFKDPLVKRAAGRLVEFFRGKNRWVSFKLEELHSFYEERGWSRDIPKCLYGLQSDFHDGVWLEAEHRYISRTQGHTLQVTDLFIKECQFESA